MMSEENVRVTVTHFEVTLLPQDFESGYLWTITVEYRGKRLWGIYHLGSAYSKDGAWDYEPLPSSRDDDWLRLHRFPLGEALRIARKLAPDIRVSTRFGMMTAQDAIDRAD